MCSLIYHRCGICTDCQGPEPFQQYCAHAAGSLGVGNDGSFAEYQVVDSLESNLLPFNISFATAAPLACAGLTIWTGLARANLARGDSLAIVGGGGGLGHIGVQFAKALGLKVIVIDVRDEALQLAKECGADTLVDARQAKDRVVFEVQEATGGTGAHATLNVSDHHSAAATAAAVTRMHGIMVQMAPPENVSMSFAELVFRDIRVHGSLLGTWVCTGYL